MNYIVTNLAKLTNIFTEIRGELEKGGNTPVSINLSWEKSHRPKTLSQLGFFFGGIVKAVRKHFGIEEDEPAKEEKKTKKEA